MKTVYTGNITLTYEGNVGVNPEFEPGFIPRVIEVVSGGLEVDGDGVSRFSIGKANTEGRQWANSHYSTTVSNSRFYDDRVCVLLRMSGGQVIPIVDLEFLHFENGIMWLKCRKFHTEARNIRFTIWGDYDNS